MITFLSKHEDLDEGRMAVEGIRYLRQDTTWVTVMMDH